MPKPLVIELSFVDLNGDGLVDVITSRPDNTVTFINQRKQATKLSSITNGFGIQTTLNYKPLTDSSVYTKDANGIVGGDRWDDLTGILDVDVWVRSIGVFGINRWIG